MKKHWRKNALPVHSYLLSTRVNKLAPNSQQRAKNQFKINQLSQIILKVNIHFFSFSTLQKMSELYFDLENVQFRKKKWA